jgi:PAS domain S-box-containing protein
VDDKLIKENNDMIKTAGSSTVSADAVREAFEFEGIFSPEEQLQGFITVDDNENITYINKLLCQNLGYDRLELLGESFQKITTQDDFEKLKESTARRRDGRTSSYQLSLITKKGDKKLFRISAAPLIVEGNFLGTLGIFSDITDEVRKLQNLQTSIQYHELMVKFIPLGLVILDGSGNITNMNPAFLQITGLRQNDLINKPVFAIRFLADLKYRYAIDNLLLYQIDFDFESSEIQLPTHKAFFRIRGYHLPTKSLKSYYLLVFGDISHRKQQELEVKEKMQTLVQLENHLQETISNNEKELKEKEWQLLEQARQETNRILLAKIAHFWRQPLNNATVLIQSLQDDYEFGELNEDRFNQKVNTAVEQLMSLSETLETFGYLSNDDTQKSEFCLKEVIEKAINLLSPSFQSHDIKLSTHFIDCVSTVGFPRRFGQVIVNILENALNAFLDNQVECPQISIELFYKNGKAVIIVLDNAGGIPADIASNIFDPYFTTNKNSQGLGLYLARKVISEMYAGKIDFIPHLDGAEFVISMPADLSN